MSRAVVGESGGRYEPESLLGAGGQGRVFATRHGDLAVKLCSDRGAAAGAALVERLRRVRRLPIDDLPIARPLEALQAPRVGYIMELLTGLKPLRSLLAVPSAAQSVRDWYLDTGGLRRRLTVLARLADVVAQLHARGLVYVDLSPGNVMISDDAHASVLWLIDPDNLVSHDQRPAPQLFTPLYGAPELVCRAAGCSERTDAFALAVLVFQTLTLIHPMLGDMIVDGEPELEEQAQRGELPWVGDASDPRNRSTRGLEQSCAVTPTLWALAARAFGAGRQDPGARPSAAEWADTLHRHAASTLECTTCSATFFAEQPHCPWCSTSAPRHLYLHFGRWDPEAPIAPGAAGARLWGAVLEDGGSVALGDQDFLDRRERRDAVPRVRLRYERGELRIESLDGDTYQLARRMGDEYRPIGVRPVQFPVEIGETKWCLHLGANDHPHWMIVVEPKGSPT